MWIELTDDESYRGREYEVGDVIEVGDALGERLILNGHIKTVAQTVAGTTLSDEQIEELDYKEVRALIEKYEIATDDRKLATYQDALKAYFADKREK